MNLELYCRRAVVDTHGSRLLARPWKGGLRWQPFMRRESGMIKDFDTEQPRLQMLTQPIILRKGGPRCEKKETWRLMRLLVSVGRCVPKEKHQVLPNQCPASQPCRCRPSMFHIISCSLQVTKASSPSFADAVAHLSDRLLARGFA